MNDAPGAPPSTLTALVTRAPWRLIGLVMLVVVLTTVDLRQVGAQLARIGPLSVAGALLAFAVLLACRCWRWRLLTQATGDRGPLLANLISCNRSIWLGLATPGRIGEFRRAGDLAISRGWGVASASALVLFDLLLDLGAYVALAVAGAILLFFPAPLNVAGALAAVAAFAACVFAVPPLLSASARFGPLARRVPGVAVLPNALGAGFRDGAAWLAVATTLGAALAYSAMIACLATPLAISLSLAHVVIVVGLSVAAGALPISYFGVGTRDVALIGFFELIGESRTDAIAVSLLFLVAQLIGLVVSIGLGMLLARLDPGFPANADGDHGK